MNKVICNVIRDFIPLYTDDVVSEDTKRMVEAHLADCKECKDEAEKIKKSGKISTDNSERPMKKIKSRLTKKQITAICVTVFLTAAVIGGWLSFVFWIGYSAPSDDVTIYTRINGDDGTYLNQNWSITFIGKGHKDIAVYTKPAYSTDENGNEIETGVIAYVRELPFPEEYMGSDYTGGFAYVCNGYETPPEDFDFTYTVVFSDRTVVYSVREEGLFEKQPEAELGVRHYLE